MVGIEIRLESGKVLRNTLRVFVWGTRKKEGRSPASPGGRNVGTDRIMSIDNNPDMFLTPGPNRIRTRRQQKKFSITYTYKQ